MCISATWFSGHNFTDLKAMKGRNKESIIYLYWYSDPGYKTLVLLLVKKDNEEFVLGGRGVDVEFCFLCDAIRVIV